MKNIPNMQVKFKKLSPDAVVPSKAHPTDAGFDMTAVAINETEDYVEYVTNIAIELPKGCVGLLFPRSSNSKKDLLLANGVGVIDESYRGSLNFRYKRAMVPVLVDVCMTNSQDVLEMARNTKKVPTLASRPDHWYKVGDKVGQLIILPLPTITLVESEELSETDRGEGGFGSTGN